MKKSKAFTMAEAVLVMTILGIIATVMITTIKPARFKEQGYKVLAKSVYASIDTAVTQILVDKAPFNKTNKIYEHTANGVVDPTKYFSMADASKGGKFVDLLKEYMATARGDIPAVCTGVSYDATLLLKNGACMAVKSSAVEAATWIPGENSQTASASYAYGMIFLDTNGQDEPNVIGTDQFYIPLDENGIISGS